MEKRKLIWYWIITGLLSFCIFFGGLTQALQLKETVQGFKPLGYPTYFISLIGVWKMLGVIAILVPRFRLIKEWAYAGFVFDLTAAVYSSIRVGDPVSAWAPIIIGYVIIALSYIFYHKKQKAALTGSIR